MSAWDALASEHRLYERTPIVAREPLAWPGGKPLALAIVVSVEYYQLQQPERMFVPPNLPGLFGRGPYPDIGTYSRRAYGNRVGIFRVIDTLERHGLRATAAVDAMSALESPIVVRECRERNWEIAGHGWAVNQVISARMSENEERDYVARSVEAVEAIAGTALRGWHGPEYGESRNTPAILAARGLQYVLDWPNDEQPYWIDTGAGRLVSVPPAVDLDDVVAHWHRRLTMRRWQRAVAEAIERLAVDGRRSGRLLALNLHPWLIGQPHRIGYLDELLGEVCRRDDVWFATAGEIADWYRQASGSDAPPGS